MRSSWEGRSMLGKNRNLKVLRMSSPIVEILSGAAAHVLHVARGPQRPYSENLKNPKFRKNKKSENMALSIFLWNCLFPLKRRALVLGGWLLPPSANRLVQLAPVIWKSDNLKLSWTSLTKSEKSRRREIASSGWSPDRRLIYPQFGSVRRFFSTSSTFSSRDHLMISTREGRGGRASSRM